MSPKESAVVSDTASALATDAKYIIYRIVGNDLPPRHASDQSLRNVQFILDNEQPFPQCEKRWILNRIANETSRQRLIELLQSRNQLVINIPFTLRDYAKCNVNWRDYPMPNYTEQAFKNPVFVERYGTVLLDGLLHDKNIYAMNNNGARNVALRAGKASGARWILPLDGNIFISQVVCLLCLWRYCLWVPSVPEVSSA